MNIKDEFYDNVDKEDYLNFLLLTCINNFVAEEIRWLKKVEIIPNDKCCCCNKKTLENMKCYVMNVRKKKKK